MANERGTNWASATPEQAQAYRADNDLDFQDIDTDVPENGISAEYVEHVENQIEWGLRDAAIKAAHQHSDNIDDLLENAQKIYDFLRGNKTA